MPNPLSRLAALGVASALLLTILPLAGLGGAAGPQPPLAGQAPLPPGAWTKTIPEQTPRPAPSAEPWWQTTSRDLNRNGLVDWLERREEPYPVGVSYDHEPTAEDKAALEALGKPVRVTLSDALLIGLTDPALYPVLATLPGVVMVEPYGKVVFYGDVQTAATKARNSTEYPVGAWDLGVTGKGVNIAIVDTGIDDGHPGLAGKRVAGFDAVCTDDEACVLTMGQGSGDYGELRQQEDGGFNPDDKNQHGTAVSGMATSTGADPNSPNPDGVYMGGAPNASLVDVRIGTALGAGPFENYVLEQEFYESAMNGLQWTIDHVDSQWPGASEENRGVDIISLSWGITSTENGGSDGTDMHSRRLDEATEAGIVVSVAAGNDGPDNDGLSGMGSSSLSVTVGATDDQNTILRDDDIIAGYSSRGPRRDNNDGYPYDELKPDVSAPGTDIIQAVACTGSVTRCDAEDNSYSGRGSGTSYATPAVAGVMALLLETNGNLTPALVKEILRTTAERRGPATYPELDPFWNKDYGWGMVDALIAVEEAMLLKDPENVDVELQAHIMEVNETEAGVTVSGLAWARRGVVERVEYSLDDGAWREALYQVPDELPLPTGEYLNWTIPLAPTELRTSGDHVLFVRSVGSNGNHSLTPHAHFEAEGHPPLKADQDYLLLLLGMVTLAGVLVAGLAVMSRSGKQEEQVLEAQKVKD